MTDAEIIKVLEHCSNAEPCENCPCQKQCDETDLAEIALDLINRQKAEIEKCVNTLCKKEDTAQLIAKERQLYYDEWQMAKAEIERLKLGVNVELDNYASEFDSKIKAEAMTEFADKLQDRCLEQGGCIYASDIGAVLNEMEGDTK